MNKNKPVTEPKKNLLNQFESTLDDFWGEEVTKNGIKAAWRDFLDSVSESEIVPEEYYKLSKEERESLYNKAGL